MIVCFESEFFQVSMREGEKQNTKSEKNTDQFLRKELLLNNNLPHLPAS